MRSRGASVTLRPVQSAREIRRLNILYAEDDAVVRKLTVQLLTRAGYQITPVENGLAAWETLQKQNFDLLITDNDMPNLTGVELVTKLRRNNVAMPIILASGSAGFFSGEQYHWLNFSACLQKPFLPHELIETVGRAFTAPK